MIQEEEIVQSLRLCKTINTIYGRKKRHGQEFPARYPPKGSCRKMNAVEGCQLYPNHGSKTSLASIHRCVRSIENILTLQVILQKKPNQSHPQQPLANEISSGISCFDTVQGSEFLFE